MKKVVEIGLKIYSVVRTYSSPKIFKKYYQGKIEHYYWKDYKDLSMKGFSEVINKLPYLWDIHRGLLDCSFPLSLPDYFFEPIKKGRDRDDFARAWTLWALYHNLKAQEFIVLDYRKPFSTSHFVTIIQDEKGKFWLMNYEPYGAFDTLEQAQEALTQWYEKDYLVLQEYFYLKEE